MHDDKIIIETLKERIVNKLESDSFFTSRRTYYFFLKEESIKMGEIRI